MTAAEYWLLRSALRSFHSIAHFKVDDADQIASVFNETLGSITPRQLRAALQVLVERGDLTVRWSRPRGGAIISNPTPDQIEAAFERDLLDYGLAPQGGALWEAAARPDWTRFVVSHARITDDSREYFIIAQEQWVAEQYFAYRAYFTSFMGAPSGPERWDVLEPWPATYWKTLPRGYRVRFPIDRHGSSPELPWPPAARTFKAWVDGWHHDPWGDTNSATSGDTR